MPSFYLEADFSEFIFTVTDSESVVKPKISIDWVGSKIDFLRWVINPTAADNVTVAVTFSEHFFTGCRGDRSHPRKLLRDNVDVLNLKKMFLAFF